MRGQLLPGNAMRARLAVMMFLEYFVWGAWYVTIGTYLGLGLRFTGQQVGWTTGATAIGAIVAPFFVGLIADRYFATQRVLAALHAGGALLLWVAAQQHSFAPLYLAVLGYSLLFMPTLALTNSLAFRQMRDTRLEFGAIRVFGSFGWIVAGLVVGQLGIEATAVPLRIAAVSSLLLSLYCLTLPHTPALANRAQADVEGAAPLRAWVVLRDRSTAVFALASLLICVPLQFYYAFTNLFLNELGVPNAAARMSGGQMSELACMLLIPVFFRRLGVKYMLAVGMLAWVLRYVLFAWGVAPQLAWMLWGGILLHGICYDFFFVTGQIYIDRRAPVELRAATQGLITLLTYGVGMFVGAWLSGRVVDAYALPAAGGVLQHDWHSIWLFGAGCAAVVLVLFLLVFVDDKEPAERAIAART
jgi:nucleoside transporter